MGREQWPAATNPLLAVSAQVRAVRIAEGITGARYTGS